ncbi:MAG: hypothetical protein AAFO69_08920, partial [Bacteroidota bacterium]
LLKLLLAFAIATIGLWLLRYIPDMPTQGDLVYFIGGTILLAFAEVLLSPTIHAIIVRYSNPRFYAILFAVYYGAIHLQHLLIAFLPYSITGDEAPVLTIGILLLEVAAAMIALALFAKRIFKLEIG